MRQTVFKDPESGFEIKGHALMIYFSLEDLKKERPGLSHKELYNLGKSSKSVMNDMITLAGLK